MILPTKRLSQDKALIAIGSDIIRLLKEPKTISRLWAEYNQVRKTNLSSGQVSYEWFILALDLLYLLDTIELDRGRIKKVKS